MSYFGSVFAPLLSRLEHAERFYGLGLLILTCRLRLLVRNQALDRAGFGRPRAVATYESRGLIQTPSPKWTLVDTPDHTRYGGLPCDAHSHARLAPPQVQWLVKESARQCSREVEESPARTVSKELAPKDIFGSLSCPSNTSPGNTMDFVFPGFPPLLHDPWPVATNSDDGFVSSPMPSDALLPSPHSMVPTAPSSPLLPPDRLQASDATETGLSPLDLGPPSVPTTVTVAPSHTLDTVRLAKSNPYNDEPDRYADEVFSPFDNHYIICGMVGRGGWGRVMMTVEAHCSRVFAVKVVHKRMACRQALGVKDALLMEKECMVIGREHRVWSWARLYETWHDERNVYFVMGMCYGDLGEQIRNGDYSEPEAQLWCYEMLHAVKALKDFRIVHSDIKPENFLIDGSGAVVLSDFGLAQRPEGASLMSEDDFLMWHGLPGGTAGYLAPEALNKVDPYVAHKSDLFSLGVTFVELLGGIKTGLWNVDSVPPSYVGGKGGWYGMCPEERQHWLMIHVWLSKSGIPKESAKWDLCSKILDDRIQIEKLFRHPYFLDMNPNREHETKPLMSPLCIERKYRDLTFEEWYRPGGADSYGSSRPKFSPLMDGEQVLESQWLKDNSITKAQMASLDFSSDFDWLYGPPPIPPPKVPPGSLIHRSLI